MITRRQFLRTTIAGTGAAGLAAADAFAVEPGFALTVKHWRMPHPHWQARPPLRIAILTDIHAVEHYMPASRVASIAARTNELKPDIIFLLGDYVAALSRFGLRPVPTSDWAAALGTLRAPLGVYAVFGNHDWWSNAVDESRAALSARNITVLENRALKITKRGHDFWVAGLGDQLAYARRNREARGADDLPGTLRQIGDDAPVLLLAHEPDIFVRVPKRVTLTMCGHTHGGQVYIPLLGRPIVPSHYGQRFAYGHIVEDGRHLVVSAGLGLSVLPVRFLVPPEITMVTLSGTETPTVS